MKLDGHGARVLRAPRAAVEVPGAPDRPAPAEEGAQDGACSAACRCFMLETQSAGELAFSRDAPGHVAALHLQPGEAIVVREHQFLAATGGVEYDYTRIKGFANMFYGGGFFVDHFFAGDQEGVVWVHGYGNVFEKQLEPGETIDIEPGGWVYRDHSVADDPAGVRVQDRLPRRWREPRLQPLHRPGPRRPTERLLPPARRGGRAGGNSQRQGGGVLGGSSAGCSTTSELVAAPERRDSWMTEQTPAAAPFRARLPGGQPAPAGIVGALGLGGYQLLADVARRRGRPAGLAGVPAGRPGSRSRPAGRRDADLAAPDAAPRRGRGHRVHPAGGAARVPAAVGLPARAATLGPAEQDQRRQSGDRRDRGRDPRQAPGRLLGAA